MDKKVIIFIMVVALIIITGGFLLVKPYFFPAKNGPGWISSQESINKGEVVAPAKVLEVVLDYNSAAKPKLAVAGLTIKNGYAPAVEATKKEYKLEIWGGSDILETVFFDVPNKFGEEEAAPSAQKVTFILTAGWVANADALRIMDSAGSIVLAKKLENIPEIDNQPNFETLSQNTPGVLGKIMSFFWPPAVSAVGDGYLDIVFVGDKYADQSAFKAEIEAYRNRLEQIEPFKSRAGQIKYRNIFKFDGGYCKLAPGASFPVCDTAKVQNDVNSAAVPNDKIVILLNNPQNGGTFSGASYGGFSAINATCCSAVINWLPIPQYQDTTTASSVFVHEMGGHLLGGLIDEYQVPGGQSSLANSNCYEGPRPNSAWLDLVAPNDYVQGCYTPTAWRSYEKSIMGQEPNIDYFNAPSQQIINAKMDAFTRAFVNTSAPTVAIISPSAGSTVSGTVAVSATLSDDLGIARVNLYVDGILYKTQYLAPFNFSWNSATFSNGPHQLEVRAYDVPGNMGSAKVMVTVADGGNVQVPLAKGAQEGESLITMPAGVYTITENMALGWDFGSVVCDSAYTTGDSKAMNVKVTAGKTTTCTFTNCSNDESTAPKITSISPLDAKEDGAGFKMTINGSNFTTGSKVVFKEKERTTTFISGQQLTAQIPADALTLAGVFEVTVTNPATSPACNKQISNSRKFTIKSSLAAPQKPKPNEDFTNPPTGTGGGDFLVPDNP